MDGLTKHKGRHLPRCIHGGTVVVLSSHPICSLVAPLGRTEDLDEQVLPASRACSSLSQGPLREHRIAFRITPLSCSLIVSRLLSQPDLAERTVVGYVSSLTARPVMRARMLPGERSLGKPISV